MARTGRLASVASDVSGVMMLVPNGSHLYCIV